MPSDLTPETTTAAIRERLGSTLRRFAHADHADTVLDPTLAEDLHIITGFGPTNAPTAGTLSVMLGAIELQHQLDAPMTVIISELGAWNSRNAPWSALEAVRDQMMAFLRCLGLDESRCRLRSHLDLDNLARAGKLARYLSRQDFLDHREDLLDLYDAHGLLGSEVGITVDTLYTVADVLEPAEAGTGNTLMVSGVEEAYFTELARITLARQAEAGDLGLGWQSAIGALYFRVLEGLSGYPKMSKSIPASAIHLGMSPDALAEQILTDEPASQLPLLSAIELASGWNDADLTDAHTAHAYRTSQPERWHQIKQRYLDTFLTYAKRWEASAP